MEKARITGPDIGPIRDNWTGRQYRVRPKKFSALRHSGRKHSKSARQTGLERGFTQGGRRRLR